MISKIVKVKNPTGLQLKPASLLCTEAMKFTCSVKFKHEDNIANAKSMLSVLGAGIRAGDEIEIICEGDDETEAVERLVDFILNELEL